MVKRRRNSSNSKQLRHRSDPKRKETETKSDDSSSSHQSEIEKERYHGKGWKDFKYYHDDFEKRKNKSAKDIGNSPLMHTETGVFEFIDHDETNPCNMIKMMGFH